MKKRLLLSLLVCTVISLMLVVACAEPSPAPAPAPAPAPSPAPAPAPSPAPAPAPSPAPIPAPPPAPAPEIIELTFATIMPPQAPITQTFVQWAERVDEETGGKVQISTYLGGSLLKHGEMYRGIQDGLTDIVWYAITEDPGLWDLNSIQDLPFLGFKSNRQGGAIYNQLLQNKSLGLGDEFTSAGMRVYGVMFPPAFQLFTTETPVRLPADISGIKVYAVGEMAKVISASGGAPVDMDITDVYMSLDRGLIEGVCTHPAAMMVFGLLDFVKYATFFGDGGCYMFMDSFIWNADVYNGLPPDVKKVLEDLEPWLVEQEYAASQSEVDAAIGILQEKGATFLDLTPEEIAAWEELAQPAHEEWFAKMDSKGKGEKARVIWDEMKRLEEVTPTD